MGRCWGASHPQPHSPRSVLFVRVLGFCINNSNQKVKAVCFWLLGIWESLRDRSWGQTKSQNPWRAVLGKAGREWGSGRGWAGHGTLRDSDSHFEQGGPPRVYFAYWSPCGRLQFLLKSLQTTAFLSWKSEHFSPKQAAEWKAKSSDSGARRDSPSPRSSCVTLGKSFPSLSLSFLLCKTGLMIGSHS